MKLARRRALAVLGLFPLLLGVACSLTTSLDGLSGALDDGGTTAPRDALASEAGPDGGAIGAGAESGSDASTAPDGAPAVAFCDSLSPRPTFCDDFERGAPKGNWDEVAVNGGGVIVIDPSTRTNAGNELHATIPVFPAGGISLANVHRALAAAQQITLSYSLRIDAAPQQGSQQVMLINVSPSDGTSDFFHTYLNVTPTGVMLVEETFPGAPGTMGTFTQKGLSEPIVFGKWQRIRMSLKLSPPARVSLTVDGKTAFDDVADPFYRPGQTGVTAGIHYTNTPSGPLSLRVDDLTVDLQ